MGCTNSRSGKANAMLSTECDDLMLSNLDLLRAIECIYIQQHKLGLALSILYIKKRTEQYYKVIQTYRRYWLNDAKSALDELTLNNKLERCERQQSKEKEQLLDCYEKLTRYVSELHPNWLPEYSTVANLVQSLESSSSVSQASTSLYGNFYMASDQEIKEGILNYEEPSQKEKENLKKIKQVAITPYKDPHTCVYSTDKIVIRKKKKKRKDEEVQVILHVEEKDSSVNEVIVVKEVVVVSEPKEVEKVTKIETESTTKHEVDNYESDSESYYETDEDEQYLARLSVSQK